MLELIRAPLRPRAVSVALLVTYCALLVGAPLASAEEGAIVYTKEGLAQYEAQLAGGQVKEVTINKYVRSLRVTLKNGQYVLAKYGRKQEPKYDAALKAKGVPVTILAGTAAKAEAHKSVHHKLRYIAAGVLVVVLVVVGGVLFVSRRRKALLD